MKDRINEYMRDVERFTAKNLQELEEFRIKYLSKKGIIPALFADFKNVPDAQKKETGKLLNELKSRVQARITSLKEQLSKQEEQQSPEHDLTLPVHWHEPGSRHPVSIIQNKINDIFKRIGFTIAEGGEIEDDFHNFSALNFPPEHPARDMQDTFFIEKNPDIALRTHTSSVQVRVMEDQLPPIRIIAPGRVFRNESISARAHCIFHQVEGLYVDKNVSFADMKQTLLFFAREMFGEQVEIRLRPSYFPFTEPSAEMDVSCNICNGKGCNVCKYTGFLEIMGCGMVDPNVLEACNINSETYTGFAFGMGVERIAMLKYRIDDLRLYFENDMRFLKQFKPSLD
ncbi:MAG: phenylalanine--tRNA ligase subunit alpha [Bacteroidales bacterium]